MHLSGQERSQIPLERGPSSIRILFSACRWHLNDPFLCERGIHMVEDSSQEPMEPLCTRYSFTTLGDSAFDFEPFGIKSGEHVDSSTHSSCLATLRRSQEFGRDRVRDSLPNRFLDIQLIRM